MTDATEDFIASESIVGELDTILHARGLLGPKIPNLSSASHLQEAGALTKAHVQAIQSSRSPAAQVLRLAARRYDAHQKAVWFGKGNEGPAFLHAKQALAGLTLLRAHLDRPEVRSDRSVESEAFRIVAAWLQGRELGMVEWSIKHRQRALGLAEATRVAQESAPAAVHARRQGRVPDREWDPAAPFPELLRRDPPKGNKTANGPFVVDAKGTAFSEGASAGMSGLDGVAEAAAWVRENPVRRVRTREEVLASLRAGAPLGSRPEPKDAGRGSERPRVEEPARAEPSPRPRTLAEAGVPWLPKRWTPAAASQVPGSKEFASLLRSAGAKGAGIGVRVGLGLSNAVQRLSNAEER